jgi:heme/copper-type cytochrome/quinol oxidase subunit 2
MDDQNEAPRRYQWPWFVLAAILLFVILAVVWMSFAVRREKQERDFNAPLPSSPAH